MSRLKSNQVRYTFARTKAAYAFSWANRDGVKVALWLTKRAAKLYFYTEGENGRHIECAEPIISTPPRAHSKVSDDMLESAGFGWGSCEVPFEVLEKAFLNESKLAVTADIERSRGGKCWDFNEVTFTTWRNEEVSK